MPTVSAVREPAFTLSGAVARGPLVYVWKRGTEVLYVGVSRYGLARPLSHCPLEPEDTLEVFLYPGADSATVHAHERRMIDALKPTGNRVKKAKPWTRPHYLASKPGVPREAWFVKESGRQP